MNWIPFVEARQARYEDQHGELDERGLVRKGNVAYAAGLGLLMLGDPAAPDWLRRAALDWRESWQGAIVSFTSNVPGYALRRVLAVTSGKS